MIAEEIGLNDHLEAHRIAPVETDLGEYIIQLRNEMPSHIIAPAVHLNATQVEQDFRRVHTHLDARRDLSEPVKLLTEARGVLRDRFLAADVGITGANFLVAETGTSIIVTNEGNGDLTQILPKTHIVLASIEKLVPTLEDVSQILRVLARSATGQEMSVYTTFSTGPRRLGDIDGPENYHVVILDNGRSAMLGTSFEEMLRCIRCGACMNHCPVYHAVGGHAYGWVYPGPMGAVLTPTLIGVDKAGHLPNASTFCGRCESVCPVQIPLPKTDAPLARTGIRAASDAGDGPFGARSCGASSPSALPSTALPPASPWRARLCRAPHAAASNGCRFARGWTRNRDFPAPQGETFQQRWRARAQQGESRMSARDDILGDHPPLARRDGQGDDPAPDRRRAARARAQGHHSRARTGRRRRRGSRCSGSRPKRRSRPSPKWNPPPRSRMRSPTSCATTTCPATSRMGEDPRLRAMPWDDTALEVSPTAAATAAISTPSAMPSAAVAETGSLVMVSGPENPSTLNFLPDNHIVVVSAKDVASDYESVWTKVRFAFGKGAMPRTVNWITGPSRSGDIEQTMLLGAHGPRRLHVIVVKD